MKSDTRELIVQYIREAHQARVHDLAQKLKISSVSIHRHLRRLVSEGAIRRVGSPPLVYYIPTEQATPAQKMTPIMGKSRTVIEDAYLAITADGKLLYGLDGFLYWAHQYKPKEDVQALADQYTAQIQIQRQQSGHRWIDGTEKLQDTFTPRAVDGLFFADVYSIPVFGRTKLAKLVTYAKQSPESILIETILTLVRPVVRDIIAAHAIDTVGYIPPTVPRPVQFMDVFERGLGLTLPRLNLVKVNPGDIPVPQKILERLSERIINARESIFLRGEAKPCRSALLIDDVVGSGSSFHEVAMKLRAACPSIQYIYAFAIVGNRCGYEVVRQV